MSPPATLDDVAGDIYRSDPSDFVACRDQHVRRLREQDRELADQVAGLRKPTLAAWAVDQLALRDADMVQAIVAAGDRARSGHADPGIDAREATRELHDLVEEALGRAAAQLARIDADAQAHLDDVRRSLTAAAVDPDVRGEVVAGRLVRPLDSPGFGALSGVALSGVGSSGVDGPDAGDQAGDGSASEDRRRRRARERERTRLARALDVAGRERERAEQRQARLRRELDEAAAEVAALRDREGRLCGELDDLGGDQGG